MALKLSPNYAPSLEGLGLLLLQQRQFEKARQQFLAATQTDPKRWRSYNGLGLIADQQKQFQAALAYYNHALSLNPTAMLFNNRGYSNYLAGHWDVAEQDYLRSLRVDEKYDRALYNLGLLQTRQGKELEALGTFKKTLDEAAAYNNMGYIYMLDGKYAEADAYLQRAISSSPTYHVQANLNMQRLHELWKK
jgi:Flp pilus assembly protein TadD